MPELVCELIVSLDGFARGQRSPGYFGYFGPDLAEWIETNTALPHRMLLGRRTYEALAGLPAEVRDDGWQRMTSTPGWLFSRTLTTTDWPGLEVVSDDVVGFVRELKRAEGSELRTLGSVSSSGNCSPLASWTASSSLSVPWCFRNQAWSQRLRDCLIWALSFSQPRFWTSARCFWNTAQPGLRPTATD